MHVQTSPISTSRLAFNFFLLWLCGNCLRLTVLALPPVLPLIHHDLQLNATSIGLLNGMPPLFLACASIPGSLLIARLGVTDALKVGLLLTAIAGALRGFVPSEIWLQLTTAAMAGGVALSQVTLPSAVRDWTPKAVGFGTAVYSNGLLVGEILPVALMFPVILPLVGGSWQWAFVFWSAPVVLVSLLLAVVPPYQRHSQLGSRVGWVPNWRDPQVWQLGVMFGTVNATYFAMNGFLPDFLTTEHQQSWVGVSLSALNLGQLPASLLLLIFAARIYRRDILLAGCGALILVGLAATVFTSGVWIAFGTAVIGFAAASSLVLLLAIPPLISAPQDIHRITAAMFTISYSMAVLVPLICGVMWDLSGIPGLAFLPIAVCGVILIATSFSTKMFRRGVADAG